MRSLRNELEICDAGLHQTSTRTWIGSYWRNLGAAYGRTAAFFRKVIGKYAHSSFMWRPFICGTKPTILHSSVLDLQIKTRVNNRGRRKSDSRSVVWLRQPANNLIFLQLPYSKICRWVTLFDFLIISVRSSPTALSTLAAFSSDYCAPACLFIFHCKCKFHLRPGQRLSVNASPPEWINDAVKWSMAIVNFFHFPPGQRIFRNREASIRTKMEQVSRHNERALDIFVFILNYP